MSSATELVSLRECVLVVLAKYPESGRVKTRLAQSIGNEDAAKMAWAMLLDLLDTHINQPYQVALELDDPRGEKRLRRLYPNIIISVNDTSDLRGPRSLLRRVFSRYLPAFTKVIVIASDVPFVGVDLIMQSFCILGLCDVVIGPDESSGYYLIGMKQFHDLFTSLPPDRGPYFSKTVQIIRSLGLQHELVERRTDIDTLDDLVRVNWTSNPGQRQWRRTAKFVAERNLDS